MKLTGGADPEHAGSVNVGVARSVRRMPDDRLPKYDLTIGELFPADDRVGRWVYSVTCLVEDLSALLRPLRLTSAGKVADPAGVASFMVYNRLHVARLFEARRLIKAVDDHKELQEAVGGSLAFGKADLRALYRRDDGKPSIIEELYEQTRHRATHYMRVDSLELKRELFSYQRYPARLVTRKGPDGHPQVEYEWVTAMRMEDVYGSVHQDDFITRMQERSSITAAATLGWQMCASVNVMLQAHRRSVDFERMSSDPDGVLAELQAVAIERAKQKEAQDQPPDPPDPSPDL